MIVASLLCASRDGAVPCTDQQTCHPGVMRNACHGHGMLAQTVSERLMVQLSSRRALMRSPCSATATANGLYSLLRQCDSWPP